MKLVTSLLSILMLVGATNVRAADKGKADGKGKEPGKAPVGAKPLVENDRVRVVNVKIKVGDKLASHSHPGHVTYTVKGGQLKFTVDGKSHVENWKAGEVTWHDAVTHSVENVGKEAVEGIVVELKDGGKLSAKPKGDDPVKVSPKNYKVRLENDRVRVLEGKFKAGEKSPMHSHPDSVVYAVKSGKAKFVFPDGKSQDVELKQGEAMFNDAFAHAPENSGKTDIHVILVELKGGTPTKGKK